MQYGKLGIVYLQEQLKNTGFILKDRKLQTLQNPQRMMRFVEVCIGNGKPCSSFLNQKQKKRTRFPPIIARS
jgi:tRNA dimethylallyltransferase